MHLVPIDAWENHLQELRMETEECLPCLEREVSRAASARPSTAVRAGLHVQGLQAYPTQNAVCVRPSLAATEVSGFPHPVFSERFLTCSQTEFFFNSSFCGKINHTFFYLSTLHLSRPCPPLSSQDSHGLITQ